MSGYTNFAVIGAGGIGKYIVQQLLKDKAAGIVKEVVVLSRQGSKTTVEGSAKVIEVDYSNEGSIQHALTGVDVVISTIPAVAIDIQAKIAVAAKNVGVKLFVPSDFGGKTDGETEGVFGAKGNVQSQLKALDMPYTAFYTGLFADYAWVPFLELDVRSGKVSIGGDGNRPLTFTSRTDIARYVSYVLTHVPAEQLKNRALAIAGDTKTFNEVFKAYEEKTGKKLQVTYVPVSEYDARIAANPKDFVAFLHRSFATSEPLKQNGNHLYPDWNPSPVIDNMPVA
ncbi:NAD-P-binding protein [Russula emetica]|nr:NAD-P-binding protein [Russula emetica]